MYEHPIKRAGLSFNRILYSNTKAVLPIFPASNPGRFSINFLMKTYDSGKEVSRKGKCLHSFQTGRVSTKGISLESRPPTSADFLQIRSKNL